jgi:NADH-quinone oxidoreductase subunit L
MGGVRKYMPITWITSLLGTLALIGTPLFSGFYSKDSIIEAVHFSNLPASGFAYFAVLAGVFVTSFYSFRLYFLVFHGKERYDQNPDAHHDDHHDDHGHHGDGKPHESPWVVTVPLLLLAIPSVVIGYLTIEPDAVRRLPGRRHRHQQRGCTRPWPSSPRSSTARWAWWRMPSSRRRCTWRCRCRSAWYMYMVNPAVPAAIAPRARPLVVVLENKYYMDWINENIMAKAARGLGVGLWKGGDRGIIEGAVVNLSWKIVGRCLAWCAASRPVSCTTTPSVMIAGVLAFMTYFVWLAK